MLRIEGWGVNHKRVERKSRTRLRSSIVVITPWRALVRARALFDGLIEDGGEVEA